MGKGYRLGTLPLARPCVLRARGPETVPSEKTGNPVRRQYRFRMPLVLGPGESGVWLGPDFARFADRSAIQLTAEPER